MKKTYINPETLTVKLTMQTLIAATNPEGFNENLDNEGEGMSPDKMLSRRRRDVWEDEELEEEEDY